MGGEIRVESELDIGTKFSWDLTFPIDKAINERAENIPDRIVTLRGIRVLAAEDNSLNSEILKFILEDMGRKRGTGSKSIRRIQAGRVCYDSYGYHDAGYGWI